MASLRSLPILILALISTSVSLVSSGGNGPKPQSEVTPSSGDIGNIDISSFTQPGIQFRRATPLVSSSSSHHRRLDISKLPVQNHVRVHRIAQDDDNGSGCTPGPGRSARLWSGRCGHEKKEKRAYYENATSIDRFAASYATRVSFGGQEVQLVLDSGSADTWIRSGNFSCRGSVNETRPQQACSLGPSFSGAFPDPVPNQHFSIHYSDGETIAGPMGFLDVEIAGIAVKQQKVALATQGFWRGDNVTSGVLGLAYPSLTSAYWGTDLSDSSDYLSVPYSPLFTTMVTQGLVEPYWCLALNRNSSDGVVSFGGLPPLDLSRSYSATTSILIANISPSPLSSSSSSSSSSSGDGDGDGDGDSSTGATSRPRPGTAHLPSYYTVVPSGLRYGSPPVLDPRQFPFILDSATTLIYLPPDLAAAVNARFSPPAQHLFPGPSSDGGGGEGGGGASGSYFTACDATPPRFGVEIRDIFSGDRGGSGGGGGAGSGGTRTFWVNPRDMINRAMRDPATGLCPTAIASGGEEGPYVLGVAFLTNVMVMMDVGEGTVGFWSRQFYR